jgi:hypothetical protein
LEGSREVASAEHRGVGEIGQRQGFTVPLPHRVDRSANGSLHGVSPEAEISISFGLALEHGSYPIENRWGPSPATLDSSREQGGEYPGFES